MLWPLTPLRRKQSLCLFAFWAIVFLGHSWEAGLKMDAMTYAALAKHVLSTGDWKILHYTRSAYAEFYQHPPLGIWIEALIFKTFGISDFTARLFPALSGLLCLAGIWAWAARIEREEGARGPWLGFLAGLILLTSTRYVKFATDFFLDGPLALFLIWTGVFHLLSLSAGRSSSRALLAIFSGLSLGAAFLTKGLAALPVAAAILLMAILRLAFRSRSAMRSLGSTIIGLIAAGALVFLWVWLGGGDHYLQRYWIESVSARLGAAPFSSHLDPAKALLTTYWPWLPAYVFGLFRFIRAFREEIRGNDALTLALLCSLALFGAFTYNGFYLEHYLVPFYPFAALVSAWFLCTWLWRPSLTAFRERTVNLALGLAGACALALAVLPIKLHLPRGEPLRSFVSDLQTRCSPARTIYVTSRATDRWMALAVVLWLTPSEADSWPAPDRPPAGPADLLITHSSEAPSSGWRLVPIAQSPELKAWIPENSRLCGI